MDVKNIEEIDDGDSAYPFPDNNFVSVEGPAVVVVVPDSGMVADDGYIFRPVDGGDVLEYEGVLSGGGTFTDYDTFRRTWNSTVADAVESAGYSVVNAE